MTMNKFPKGWDDKRVRKVLAHYESQTEAEGLAEDEAAYKKRKSSMIEIPVELVPRVRKLIATHRLKKSVVV